MFEIEEKHFWYKGMRLITDTLLKKYLRSGNRIILDVGCGTGGNFNLLSQYGRVFGIDNSEIAIKLAQKRRINNIKLASLNEIPFKNNSFDLITCFDVLGHEKVFEKKALKEFNRVLKSGGLLLIRSAAYKWLYSYHDIKVQNRRRYTLKSLNNLIKSNNFISLKKTYANTILFPLIAFRRFISNIFNIERINSDALPVNRILNFILYIPFIIESLILRYANLPFGSSVIILARKK